MLSNISLAAACQSHRAAIALSMDCHIEFMVQGEFGAASIDIGIHSDFTVIEQ